MENNESWRNKSQLKLNQSCVNNNVLHVKKELAAEVSRKPHFK